MERILAGTSRTPGRSKSRNPWMGLGWGSLGGLAGTLTMDLVLMAVLSAFGLPALTCFSIVGNTVACFLSMPMPGDAGAVRLGMITHYLVGPLFGAVFGALMARVPALRVYTLKKSILWAILYIEVLSQPLLVTTPILLKMTMAEIVQWYGGAFGMHLLLAVVLGVFVSCGLKRTGVHHQAGDG